MVRSKTSKSIPMMLETAETPTILAGEMRTSIPNVSGALRVLQSRDSITTLTPNEKAGKIFFITERGRAAIRKINEMGAM